MLGTFDSRAVAIAYYRSAMFRERLDEVRQRHEAATAAGDDAEAERIAASMEALQGHVHTQGFGNAPIDDVLALVAERIPALAAEQGVDVVVSRWHVVHRSASARTVDLTMALGGLFEPDEATRKVMREIVTQEPVPLDRLQGAH